MRCQSLYSAVMGNSKLVYCTTRTIVANQRIKAGPLLAWAVGVLVTIHKLTLAVLDSGTDLYLKVIYFTLSILTLVAVFVIGYTYLYCYIFSESRLQTTAN